MKLSVCLATFNEEKNIKECLESVKWANEIIIVDGTSTDKTVEIASSIGRSASGRKKPKIEIIIRENPLMFHLNKQKAFDRATGDWILYLDADERVGAELKEEMLSEIKKGEQDGFWIPRKNIIFGQWIKHSLWYPDYQLRLFKKGKAYLPCQSVHEQPVLKGSAGHLNNPLIHYNYRTVSQYVRKLNELYTENDKRVFVSQNKEISWHDALRFPAHDFLINYFSKEGYKDGLHGLVLSLLQGFSSFVTFAKVWEEKKFPAVGGEEILANIAKETSAVMKELEYWVLTAKINQEKNYFKKLVYRTKRKLIGKT